MTAMDGALHHHNSAVRVSVRSVLTVQAVYYLVTGAWAIVSPSTFQKITGPKHDIWLLKTVSALIMVVGAVLAFAVSRPRLTPDARLLAGASALVLMAVDVTYVAKRTISPVYLLDAPAQLLFIAAAVRDSRERDIAEVSE